MTRHGSRKHQPHSNRDAAFVVTRVMRRRFHVAISGLAARAGVYREGGVADVDPGLSSLFSNVIREVDCVDRTRLAAVCLPLD